jgi:hypothetical protein
MGRLRGGLVTEAKSDGPALCPRPPGWAAGAVTAGHGSDAGVNPPLRVFFGSASLPVVSQVYAERLKTWNDWAEVSALAEGSQA